MINGFLKVENFYLEKSINSLQLSNLAGFPGKTCLKYYAPASLNQCERGPHLINQS